MFTPVETPITQDIYNLSVSIVLLARAVQCVCAGTDVRLVTDLVAGGEGGEQVMDEGNLGLSRSSHPITDTQPSKTHFLCFYSAA